jgi:creatinine amidohydrolase/Fe(II)-dependent formamide hydrolase-like protein
MTIAGHAGQFETSTMLAMNPAFVREPRATRESDPFLRTTIPGTRIEASGSWQSFDGFTDFPHLATADLGVRLLAVITRDVASALTTFATDSSLP